MEKGERGDGRHDCLRVNAVVFFWGVVCHVNEARRRMTWGLWSFGWDGMGLGRGLWWRLDTLGAFGGELVLGVLILVILDLALLEQRYISQLRQVWTLKFLLIGKMRRRVPR